ncbi:MAG: hypothetical protein ACXQT5_01970 [Candidatus Syntropharchaeia archaeon]
MNLFSGLNNVSFTYVTPSCSKCSGITPGMYNITAYVVYKNETIANATTSILIKI